MKRIHESLRRALQRHRLVFWYDGDGDWADAFEAFDDPEVVQLRVEGNEFGTKVRIARAPDQRFLVYVPEARPPDAENWLLDLVLQGHEFRADRASLVLEDVGLPQEYRHLVADHAAFFSAPKRVEALENLLDLDDEPADVRLKMMAVLTGTSAEVDAMLLRFLDGGPEGSDPVEDAFASAALAKPFWREVGRLFGYTTAAPSLLDFAVSLFRGANPLDTQTPLHPHARVFLRRWQDSQRHAAAFRAWSKTLESDLRVVVALDATDGDADLGDADAFEAFERYSLHRLCARFEAGESALDLRATLEKRRSSFWYADHEDGYAALDHAVELRELLGTVDLAVESVEDGAAKYVASWWKVDRAYRRCALHLKRYGQVQLMDHISRWAEGAYVNNFLLPLADRWGDRVAALDHWACGTLQPQQTFFDTYVRPFHERDQKVFVIVSDGLRYEAAAEFAERLASENRWTAELDGALAALPSYTQLGMASLLPGTERTIDPETLAVSVDGQSATGTLNRSKILHAACGGRGVAVQADEFLALNTKTEGRDLMKGNDVIYIFHNLIDHVGDKLKTEGETLQAVETTFEVLDQIVRKVANINGTNMLLTADHGFLFQQAPVDDEDMTPLPDAAEWTNTNRRFAVGRGIAPAPGVTVFSANALGVDLDGSVAFPLSLGRFPLQGSGKRYVHGGISPQEVVVPVVRINKARADDTRQVDVDLLRVPTAITTGQLSVVLYQEQPVAEKVLARPLRIGVFAPDGTELSDLQDLPFDSSESEPRRRETTVLLTLSHEADAYNNQEVEVRLMGKVAGTQQPVLYKAHALKLRKPFASDFDEF